MSMDVASTKKCYPQVAQYCYRYYYYGKCINT